MHGQAGGHMVIEMKLGMKHGGCGSRLIFARHSEYRTCLMPLPGQELELRQPEIPFAWCPLCLGRLLEFAIASRDGQVV